jgi:hypothetical protein
VTASTTEGLTCEEIHAGFDALIKRVAEIAADCDLARKIASEATKELVRARHELILRDAVNTSLLDDISALGADNRQLTARVHELAVANEDLHAQLDRTQQEPPSARRTRWRARNRNRL